MYKLDESIVSDVSRVGACSSCATSLSRIAEGFKQLKHHGIDLKKQNKSLGTPKDPDCDHYRNVSMQNEWIRGNVFDAMGNYLFYHTCVAKASCVCPQRLSKQ